MDSGLDANDPKLGAVFGAILSGTLGAFGAHGTLGASGESGFGRLPGVDLTVETKMIFFSPP